MLLKEKEGKLADVREKLGKAFEEAGSEMDLSKVTVLDGADSAAKAEQIRNLNTEAADLAKSIEDDRKIADIAKQNREWMEQKERHPGHQVTPEGGTKASPMVKSVGELFTDSYETKNQAMDMDSVDLKTLFETAAGWTPESVRGPRLVENPQRPIQVTDIIPTSNTTQNAIKYMEETTFTNNAAEVAEGGQKPEAALALTERTDPVQKIAVWLPVTDEQLEDVSQVQGYINNRLGFMVRQRLDGQILVGDGTSPNLSGILDRSGLQTQAKGADPIPDAVYKAMTKVRVTGRAIPTAYVTHPNDWQEVRLLRTADGIYIWGNPSEAGPERIWGLQVVQAEALTEGTGLVGDFANFAELVYRRGLTMKVSDSHSDFFIKNKQVILAEIRAALAVYRGSAFCQVTGI